MNASTSPAMTPKELKRAAAAKALDYVEDGMRLGIGTGSTAEEFVDLLAARVRDGLKVVGVPTSERTARLAEKLGVPLTTLDETPELDLTIDGADEVDAKLRLIKGGGGALLREKIVATASSRMIVIADDTKLVDTLGRFPLPVEVIPFGAHATARQMTKLARDFGCEGEIVRREDQFGDPFLTDSNNFIYDGAFGRIPDPDGLAAALNSLPGVVENGLFIGIAAAAILAGEGGVRVLEAG